ncbi:MAG: response regulator [Candidatus Omnitrophica bacterium]|nr:response regulator [Patescibacteria group bacterium]MDD5487931.1 response regulator [Candidatus Omnitrophota bacterium]
MLKLLVVDDEVDICDFVRSFFKERNFEVFVAYNGKKAIETIEKEKPDIVLLDMNMPGMTGLEALRELRQQGNQIKTIMVTAVDEPDKIEEAKKHGVVEYITKPLLLEQLERTVFTVAEQIRMDSAK